MGAAQRLEGVVLRAMVPGGWDGATGIEAAQLVAKEWCCCGRDEAKASVIFDWRADRS